MSDNEPTQPESQDNLTPKIEHQSAPPLIDSLRRASYFYPSTDPYSPQIGPLSPPPLPDGVPTLHQSPRRRSPLLFIAIAQSTILIGLLLFLLVRSGFFHFSGSSQKGAIHATATASTISSVDGTTTSTTPLAQNTQTTQVPSTTQPAKPAATATPKAADTSTPQPTAVDSSAATPKATVTFVPQPIPTSTPIPVISCASPGSWPSTKSHINIFTTAIGRSGTDNSCAQVGKSYTTSNQQYVWCRRLGGEVRDSSGNFNHWWLWTDLDTGGRGWISAYYIKDEGNDQAYDINTGNPIPNC